MLGFTKLLVNHAFLSPVGGRGLLGVPEALGVQGGEAQDSGRFVGGEHDVHGERMGLSKLLPFPIPILLSKGYELEGGGGPSHDQEVWVPIKKGFVEQGHFVPDRFRVRLRSTDTGFLTKRFLKIDARVPIAEGDLNRHGTEGLTVGRGGGVFLLSLYSAERPPTNSMFSTQERASSTRRRGSEGSYFLFSAEVHGFTGQVH
jgi:hypothetical protein